MSFTAGARLGPYEIQSALGAGGMGEVYRARDTKLGRDVAIKILPDAFAFDAERIARFAREAKVLASLNHPHIAAGSVGNAPNQFVWIDRVGNATEKVGEPDRTQPTHPVLSPDGQHLALVRGSGNRDIWLLDVKRGSLTRLTFDAKSDNTPVWAPDGKRLVFSSDRNGPYSLYVKTITGVTNEELLLGGDQTIQPVDWSSDGHFLLYRTQIPGRPADLLALPMEGNRKPFPVVRTPANDLDGQFSPDGKWVAYQSDESGRFKIYIQPFPRPAGKIQISNDGGAQVRWRGDGKELFYIGLDDRLMAVPIQESADGKSIEPGVPTPLFLTRIGGAVGPNVSRQNYVVSPDGQRFLMNTITEEAASPITVILNWKPPAH